MQIHEITRKNPHKKKKLVGRGGKRGKTSGKGTKGQKARAGRKLRPEMRDLIKKLPKMRGYKFHSIQDKAFPVNVDALERAFDTGEMVTPRALVDRGVAPKHKGGVPKVKILGSGELSKKLTVAGCTVSTSAKEKIEKAGGKIETKASANARA